MLWLVVAALVTTLTAPVWVQQSVGGMRPPPPRGDQAGLWGGGAGGGPPDPAQRRGVTAARAVRLRAALRRDRATAGRGGLAGVVRHGRRAGDPGRDAAPGGDALV